jgi:hypothetical protein
VTDPKKEPRHLTTARLIRQYKHQRHLLVRDALISKDHSDYRISECGDAAIALAEHIADGP